MKTNLTITIDSELKKRVKAYCNLKGVTMSEIISNFLWSLLEDKEFEEVFTKEGFRSPLKQWKEAFDMLRKETLNEVKQLFSSNEISLMMDALNGFIYTAEVNPREALLSEVIDAIKYQKLDEKWGVDKDKLLSKLASISSFQAFVLLQAIIQYWEEGKSGEF